tara:strand:+ start:249 stop:488 length:240 start_codon:yes stop_codon:yes gene_type:complete
MLQIQVKDNCYLCLKLDTECAYCNGTGEVLSWVTLEALTEMITMQQNITIERNTIQESIYTENKFPNISDLEINPNPNI